MTKKLEDKAILIIGAGHFGQRAAALLKCVPHASLWLVDRDITKLRKAPNTGAKRIAEDGVHFLTRHFSRLAPSTLIIPAVPVHLAFEWLKAYINKGQKGTVTQVQVPKSIGLRLHHTMDGSEGSLLASYADFRCPDDCPEPASRCTVTGKARRVPLYRLLAEARPYGFQVHVIRSRQLAPGVGGYRMKDLEELLGRVSEGRKGKWLVATACKCHGIVTALQVAR